MAKVVTMGEIMLRLSTPRYLKIIQSGINIIQENTTSASSTASAVGMLLLRV